MEKIKKLSINFRKRKVVNSFDFNNNFSYDQCFKSRIIFFVFLSTKTYWHIFLTKSDSNRRNFVASSSHSLTLGLKPCCDVVDICSNWNVAAPKFFSKSTCSDPNFSFNVGRVDDLTPHTNFSTNYIDTLNFSCETCV